MAEEKLVPPDLVRCQVEHKGGSFMTLGPRPMVRCGNSAHYLIKDKTDSTAGWMSICTEHVKAAKDQFKGKLEWKEVRRVHRETLEAFPIRTPRK